MLAVVSCADTIGPTTEPPLEQGPHHLRWNRASGPVEFAAAASTPTGELPLAETPQWLQFSKSAGDSLALDKYHASFWAKRGERRSLQIDYISIALDGTTKRSPFLEFSVAEPVTDPLGKPIAVGDSILVTATVDPVELVVHLEPSGLQFGLDDPTVLSLWYTGADGDFNGDGVVDERDAQIESQMLGVWYQEGHLSPWEGIPSTQLAAEKRFAAVLEHFSGYAISW